MGKESVSRGESQDARHCPSKWEVVTRNRLQNIVPSLKNPSISQWILLFMRNFVVPTVLLIEPGSLLSAGKREGSHVILRRTFLLLLSLCQDEKKDQRKPISVCIYTSPGTSSLFKSVECEALNKFQAFKC